MIIKKTSINLDILPSLKKGDSHYWTLMSERKNVLCSVYVTVMHCGTVQTRPFSYSQTRSTLRTTIHNTGTARTSYGGILFIYYFKQHFCVLALYRSIVLTNILSLIYQIVNAYMRYNLIICEIYLVQF